MGNILGKGRIKMITKRRLTGGSGGRLDVGSLLLLDTPLRTRKTTHSNLPVPRLIIDELDDFTSKDALLEVLRNLRRGPVAEVDEDAVEGLPIIRLTTDHINAINAALAEKILEDLLDIAPADVGEGTGNAERRIVVGRHCSQLVCEDTIQ